jgi:uncharacterized protein involved in type VI secretion and phage assembly
MSSSTLVQAPKVGLGSANNSLHEYWAQRMTSLSVEMQFQVPTRLTMRFSTPVLGTAAPAFPFALDTEVSVTFPVEREGGGASFVKPSGSLFVTEIGAEREGDTHGEFVVVAHDASFRLTRRHRVATYTEVSASSIARGVAADAGLSIGTVDSTGDALPYVLQSDTDFGFITTLARRHGFDWWVDGETFHFRKPQSSPPVVPVSVTDDLIRFSVSTTAVASPEVKVNGWDRDRQEKVSGSASPSALPANEVPGVSDAKNGTPKATTLTTSSVRTASQGEAEAVAKAIVTSQMASAVSAQGELTGAPDIVPGVIVEVSGEHLGGKYHVTQVEHRYSPAGYLTRFTAGDRVPTGLADLLGSGSLAEHLGAYSGLPALLPAMVTQIGTGENLGRVKVKFPFLSDDDDSHWARVLSAGGGPERGFWFLPEIDDEVLIAFEGGDTRFPVVMGGLYGRVNTPEDQLINDGKISSRSVRSRLGHYMDFVDGTSEDKRSITLGLGKNGKPGTDYTLRIGEDRFDIEVPEGKPIAIKAGAAQITFTDKKSIEVRADAITVKADNDLVLEGKDVKVKGTASVSIEQGGNKVALGSGGLEAKGTPTTSIKGGPQVSIG